MENIPILNSPIGSIYTLQLLYNIIGIASCGSGVGTFILAPLSVLLISEYGWRGATWILAGVILNGVVAGMVFRPVAVPVVQKKEPAKEKQTEQLMDFSLLLNPTFVLFCLSSFLCLIGKCHLLIYNRQVLCGALDQSA